MKRNSALLLCLLLLAGTVLAQDTYYTIFDFSGFIPEVNINDRTAELQRSLYPSFYRQRAVRGDMNWLAGHDSLITDFWANQGDTVLHIMRELAGLEWQESEFQLYLVRFYPTIGSSDPLILPVGATGDGTIWEVAPDGNRLILDVLFQLSRRMLDQTVRPEQSLIHPIAYHPLMQPGPYRRDNLAMLLAMAVCQNIIGYDSTLDAYQSAFWQYHGPIRAIFEKHFLNQWILSPERPLTDWINAEGYGSPLVKLTRPPRPRPAGSQQQRREYVEGLPLKGQLGFSVTIDDQGRLEVSQIDPARLAYANGLREGDRVFRVDGHRVKSQKELVEYLLAGLDKGGALVEIIRDGATETLLMQPIKLMPEDEYYYLDDYDESPTDSTSVPEETPDDF